MHAPSPGPDINTPSEVDGTGTAHELARRVGVIMYAADRASREFLQLELLSCAPGRARMRMTVRAELLNGHAICHGGFIFALADSTFAFACNSHNAVTVAAGCSIEFLRPAQLGDVLTAQGTQQLRQGRTGVYDVGVTNQRGETVALFRGKSTTVAGTIVPTADGL